MGSDSSDMFVLYKDDTCNWRSKHDHLSNHSLSALPNDLNFLQPVLACGFHYRQLGLSSTRVLSSIEAASVFWCGRISGCLEAR